MRKMMLVLCCLFAVSAFGAQISDFYVIPVVAHTNGANGTAWRSDVSIQNFASTPLNVDMSLIASGEGLLDNITSLPSITVPPGGSVIVPDILQNQAQTSGALLVGANQPFALTSRTYNRTANGTFGQTVPPASDVASTGSSTIYIPGLIANGNFRTNLGLVMSATTTMVVSVTINGASGQSLGARTFTVPAGATDHVQFGTTSVAPAPFDIASATIRIASGNGTVIAYASIVDNATGDASFIAGNTAATGSTAPLRLLLTQ